MIKSFKKILSVFLAAIIVFCITPLSNLVGFDFSELNFLCLKAKAATYSGKCGENLTWSFDNSIGELVVGGSGDMTQWTNSGDIPWDDYRSSIKHIIINNGVTSISSSAFALCDISTITIPDTVTRIDGYAFAFCYKLKNITIGKGVLNIDDRAFYDCRCIVNITVNSDNASFSSDEYGVLFNKDRTALIQYPAGSNRTSYIIPNSVTALNSRAFYFCENLIDVIIPDGVADIPSETFAYCSSLTSITIPNAVTSIGSFAFEYCDSLDEVIIGNGIDRIGHWAFYGTGFYNNSTNWKNNVLYVGKYLINAQKNISGFYKIKDGTTVIADHAFYGCENLENVTIPDTITSIGASAFSNCYKIKSVIIPHNVKSIGASAFNRCTNLENIIVESDNDVYSSDDNGVLFDKNKTELIRYPAGKSEIYYEIPDGVITIMDDSFSDCSYLTSIIIPDSVINAGDRTFYNCDSLVSVNLGNGITSIGFMLFCGCDNLANVIIPDSVISIESSAFEDCASLMNITIPDGVTSIGRFVFDGTGVYNNFSNWENNVLYINKCLVAAKNSISGPYIVKDGTIVIAEIAFENCNSLTNITIPDSISNIGDGAFWNSNSLTDVYYNNSASQWDKIKIGYDNEPLKNARIHFEHTHIVNTLVESVEPNCNDSGYKKGFCVCGQSLEEETPSLGHDIVIDKAVASTCTSTGLTEGQHCSRCEDATVAQEIIPMIKHTAVTSKNDSTNHWGVCSCGEKLNLEGHKYGSDNVCDVCEYEKVITLKMSIRKPSTTTISYGDSIILHADMNEALPSGWTVKWTADNGNFSYSANGETCTITPSKSGDTTFTATVYDENGNEISKDTQTMKSKAGFFDKFAAFFRKLFGMTKIIQQSINF